MGKPGAPRLPAVATLVPNADATLPANAQEVGAAAAPAQTELALVLHASETRGVHSLELTQADRDYAVCFLYAFHSEPNRNEAILILI